MDDLPGLPQGAGLIFGKVGLISDSFCFPLHSAYPHADHLAASCLSCLQCSRYWTETPKNSRSYRYNLWADCHTFNEYLGPISLDVVFETPPDQSCGKVIQVQDDSCGLFKSCTKPIWGNKLNCYDTFTPPSWLPGKPGYNEEDQQYREIDIKYPAKNDEDLFRLPVIDISERDCTPSPFTGTGLDTSKNRSKYSILHPNLPSKCGDDMTASVVDIIGSGHYQAQAGMSYAQLLFGLDSNRTAACEAFWDTYANPSLVGKDMYLTFREGPVWDNEVRQR